MHDHGQGEPAALYATRAGQPRGVRVVATFAVPRLDILEISYRR
ncbi:hypothetical protein ONA91_29755 [Micromonospora sp. DR5-3]|nr:MULTISPECIES: hypothetical protein [unclassified Micromonospora]MCW3818632.1 hypothetical protein [Micromonospora sp. DR5-3]